MPGDSKHTGKGEFVIPDGIEPIRGYRKFQMIGNHLHGLAFPDRWNTGVNEARCMTMTFDRNVQYDAVQVFFSEAEKRKAGRAGPGGACVIADDGRLVPAPGYTYAECAGLARNNHGCGYYARHGANLSYDPPNRKSAFPGRVTGLIEAWGAIEIGEEGFRAQYARIIALTEHEIPEKTQIEIDRKEMELDTLRPGAFQSYEDYEAEIADIQLDLARLYAPSFRWLEVRKTYKDIPMFPTEEAMLEAFPVPNLKYLYEED